MTPGSDFSLGNLPFGVFETPGGGPRAGIAFVDRIVDLASLAAKGLFADLRLPDPSVFSRPSLNAFIALGRPYWRAVRRRVASLLRDDAAIAAVPQSAAKMLLPVEIGDFVDFYSSEQHATNLGKMFRDPAKPLLPNWKHLPVGYHGRASSIVLSGQNVHRPRGQINPGGDTPEFAPTRALDFELEMAFIVGRATELGSSVSVAEAEDFIFGMALLNDWSARDIQRWEYVPLGPFLGKSFATSMTPWIVTLDALEPFRVTGPKQDPRPLPYLRSTAPGHFDINLEIELQPEGERPLRISRGNLRSSVYWTMAQQIAHLTSGGSRLRVGDICASGTISGDTPDSLGSLIEITQGGSRPLTFPDGAVRRFLEDGDTVIMRAWAGKDDARVGFGELRTKILPPA